MAAACLPWPDDKPPPIALGKLIGEIVDARFVLPLLRRSEISGPPVSETSPEIDRLLRGRRSNPRGER